MKKRIDAAQIVAFPGGFSGGDEPDGSGKFIVNTFLSPALTEAIENLLYRRDGLAIGICNGFQALIKLGLLPDGHVSARDKSSPTLTFNNIARHVSTIVNVRVATDKSPWLAGFKPGDTFAVPVSHGEGKFVCSPEEFSPRTGRSPRSTSITTAPSPCVRPLTPTARLWRSRASCRPTAECSAKWDIPNAGRKVCIRTFPAISI